MSPTQVMLTVARPGVAGDADRPAAGRELPGTAGAGLRDGFGLVATRAQPLIAATTRTTHTDSRTGRWECRRRWARMVARLRFVDMAPRIGPDQRKGGQMRPVRSCQTSTTTGMIIGRRR